MRGVFFAALVLFAGGGTSACSVLTSFDGFGGGSGASGASSSGGAASGYRAAILADNPLAYWRFGEAHGATAADETGHGNTATIGNGVSWGATGALLNDANTAVSLAGAQCLEIDNGGFNFPGTAPFSLEGWVTLSAAPDTIARDLYIKNDNSNPAGRQEYRVYLQASQGLVFDRYVNSGLKRLQAPSPPLDMWTYVVASYNGTGLALYVNAVFVANLPDNRSQLPIQNPEYLGCDSFTNPGIEGALDEFAVYDHALTQGDVLAHYMASGR
jgi:hypothetical protein